MLTYTHTQASASAIWTIDHNLDLTSLSIDVRVTGSNEPFLPAKITKTSANQVVIVFTVARSGTAFLKGSTGAYINYTGFVAPVERAIDYTHSPLDPQE